MSHRVRGFPRSSSNHAQTKTIAPPFAPLNAFAAVVPDLRVRRASSKRRMGTIARTHANSDLARHTSRLATCRRPRDSRDDEARRVSRRQAVDLRLQRFTPDYDRLFAAGKQFWRRSGGLPRWRLPWRYKMQGFQLGFIPTRKAVTRSACGAPSFRSPRGLNW
jgi:hypothetical protein